jgi:ABC-type xylose transport system substrate-binding protein
VYAKTEEKWIKKTQRMYAKTEEYGFKNNLEDVCKNRRKWILKSQRVYAKVEHGLKK